MGAFVSIPLTTMLAVPLFSSYSTSFNLLFFTFNWYILLLSHPPLRVELFGLLLIRLGFFLIPALSFFSFDALIPSLASQIKAQGDLALPTRAGRKKASLIAAWSTFNVLLGVSLIIGLELLSTKVLHWRSLLNLGKTLPFPWKAVQSILGLFALRGVSILRFSQIATGTDLSHRFSNISSIASFSTILEYSFPSFICNGSTVSPLLSPSPRRMIIRWYT
jgi:hypothetical protein